MSWWAHTFLPDREALRLSSEPHVAPASEEELLAWRREQASRAAQAHLSIEQMLADPKDRAEFEEWLDERNRGVSDAVEPDNSNDKDK